MLLIIRRCIHFVLLYIFLFAAVVVFIGRIVPENALFCSHPDLLHTMTNPPTPFCVISGKRKTFFATIHFQLIKLHSFHFLHAGITFFVSIILAFSFWTVHIMHIWITVELPHLTFTKKLKSHSKVVHILVVLLCFLISVIGPIGALAKYSYIVTRVPALTCSPNNIDYIFYSLIVPCIILLGLATSFLVLLFWTVYKVCRHGHVCMSTMYKL